MRLFETVTLCVTLAMIPSVARAQATFQGVGDLPGGQVRSDVLDATRVGDVIYAVGQSGAGNDPTLCGPGSGSCVTPVLWTWNGVTATLTALPNLQSPLAPPALLASAWAITRDATYIASEARTLLSATTQSTEGVRVTRTGVTLTNTELTLPGGSLQPFGARTVSENGSIVYGSTLNGPFRAFRFDLGAASSIVLPFIAGHDAAVPVPRGASADGSVMVGTSWAGGFTTTNGRAFRYVHADPVGTVAAIPLLAGGTWSRANALSPDGNLTLVSGNSTRFPNGEVYIHNATTGLTTPLGSPNSPWTPPFNFIGGITADGSVVVATFGISGTSVSHAYFRNGNGWFHLTSALAAQGVDVSAAGWDLESMQVHGISPDGTIAFGSGVHNGSREGFVAEFPPGALAAFSLPAVAPVDTALVGAWTLGSLDRPEAVVLLPDGTYFHLASGAESSTFGEFTPGFERGRYTWNAGTGAFTVATRQDTNGSVGLSGGNGVLGVTLAVSGNKLLLGAAGESEELGTRLRNGSGPLVGGWVMGDPRVDDSSGVLLLLGNGTFLFAIDGILHDGVEAGTYFWNAANGTLSVTSTIDTSGEGGLTSGPGATTVFTLAVAADKRGLTVSGGGGSIQFTRVIDPAAAFQLPAPHDIDGDGRTDISIYRPSDGHWWTTLSGSGYATSQGVAWGAAGDVPVPGDYDGDGRTDIAIFRPSDGHWWLLFSASGFTTSQGIPWGAAGDVPVPADYDGDGRTDLAVWRPAGGTWFVRTAASGFTSSDTYVWGEGTDRPVPGDYDGDGRADLAVFRPATGAWFILTSSSNFTTPTFATFGVRTDIPVPGDYDGDGTTDIAVYRPSTGVWYLATPGGGSAQTWGAPLDRPVPADYDGDGTTDIAVFRPATGTWYIQASRSGFLSFAWGLSTDLPLGAGLPYGDPTRRGDVDGDRKADPTVYQPATGTWYTLHSATAYTTASSVAWGLATDIPVRGDYDGDGRPDRAVFRPSTGTWYISTSASDFTTMVDRTWGLATDVPVPADYDGDGITDIAVYRPASGTWFILSSTSGFTTATETAWGFSTDVPVPLDYDGDGVADLAVWRPSTGDWYVLQSSTGFTTYTTYVLGTAADIAVPGDYDGDGRTDVAVFQPSTGDWLILGSHSDYATLVTYRWGVGTDRPIPADYDGDGRTDLAVFRPSTGQWFVGYSSTGFTSYEVHAWGASTDIVVQ